MIEKRPLVTVGIPTYNRTEGLKKTLESISGQTYKNLEIIVSDNCSPNPDVEKIINEFKSTDRRIRYIRQSENIGALDNFIFVHGQANGVYFMWAADDDWFDKDYIECCLDYFLENDGHAIVGGQALYVGDSGNVVIESHPLDVNSNSPIQRVIDYYRHISKGRGNCIFYGLMRKDFIDQAHLCNEFAGDSATVAEMAFMGKIRTLNSTHIFYRLGGSSKSRKKMVAALKLPKWNAWFPGMASSHVFIKRIWTSGVYTLGGVKKLYLSLRVLLIVSKMYDVLTIKSYFWYGVKILKRVSGLIKKQLCPNCT